MSELQQSSREQRRILREVRHQYELHGASRARRKNMPNSPYASHAPALPSSTPTTYRGISPSRPRPHQTPPRGRRHQVIERHSQHVSQAEPRRSHWVRRIFIFIFLIIIAGAGVFGYKIISASNKISVAEQSIIGQLRDLLFGSGESLTGEKEGRINILLIAIGGEGHKGKDLADTIMIASIRPTNNDVALLSIPRDLYVQVPNEEYFTKINAVHSYGESQRKDGGPQILKQEIEEITGLPIHYYARVDFTAFKHIVDALGGISITMDNSFFDYWHKISFPAGTEKMNGERALAYVRARFIEGPEGGDFKRAARQQQVLLALREKVFSINTAFDFRAVNSILDSLSENIRTDMQLWEMKRFFEIARLINRDNVRSVILSTGPEGVLVGGTEVLGGEPASILRPRTGNYSEIRSIAANLFSEEVSTTLQPSAQATPSKEPDDTADDEGKRKQVGDEDKPPLPLVEIRNGTNVTGLAKKVSEDLKEKGYTITTIGNAVNRSTPRTTVYALSSDALEAAKTVGELLSAATDSGLPEGEEKGESDILLILGQDAQ